MGQTPHTLLSLRGYLYSLRGEAPLRPTAYGAAAERRGEWGGMVCWFVAMFRCGVDGRARVLWHNPFRKSFLQRAAKQPLRPTAVGGT